MQKNKLIAKLALFTCFVAVLNLIKNNATTISNVRVFQDQITIDSVVGAMFYFSGQIHFDADQINAGSVLHVYFENPPCNSYIFGDSSIYNCQAEYVLIDSLCKGDIGLIQAGRNKTVYWQYATSSNNTYARIKIGVSNKKSVLDKLYLTSSQFNGVKETNEYYYNRRGQMFKNIHTTATAETTSTVINRMFNTAGQITATDTPPKLKTKMMTYDSLNRIIDYKYNDIGQCFGWIYQYDNKSRATVSIPYLEIDSIRSYGNEYITTYDENDRMIHNFRKVTTSDNHVQDVYTYYYYYSPINSDKIDSMVNLYYEKDTLIYQSTLGYYYNTDLSLSFTITTNIEYASLNDTILSQKKMCYVYDHDKNLIIELDSTRNSLDSPFVFHEILNTYEYDKSGNKTQWWMGDKDMLQRVQTYNENNLPISRTDYFASNDSIKQEFIWKEIDLDTIAGK